ncbi:MAG: heme-binding protein [Bryobacteraceae bacterium]|nr:heme-binding protein [Bryobacteraceae bacterium]
MKRSCFFLIAACGALTAQDDNKCRDLPSHLFLKSALTAVVSQTTNGGLGFPMWGALVNRDGEVCAIAFSGKDRGAQWPGSRVIAAQKANTANAFSLPGFALSTANLHYATQSGGTLFGLQHSNPVDTEVAYGGNAANYGQPNDPMNGKKIGGVNVFGGGLALYRADGTLVGAIGVSGDTSCTDHVVAWRVRDRLNLDYVPAGPAGAGKDNIIHDLNGTGASASGLRCRHSRGGGYPAGDAGRASVSAARSARASASTRWAASTGAASGGA